MNSNFRKWRKRLAERGKPLEADRSSLQGFDPDFYLSQNPDVALSGHDPLQHFLEHGWRENRDPSRRFSVASYLDANPDVHSAGINPLIHYNRHGRNEGRKLALDREDVVTDRPPEEITHIPGVTPVTEDDIESIGADLDRDEPAWSIGMLTGTPLSNSTSLIFTTGFTSAELGVEIGLLRHSSVSLIHARGRSFFVLTGWIRSWGSRKSSIGTLNFGAWAGRGDIRLVETRGVTAEALSLTSRWQSVTVCLPLTTQDPKRFADHVIVDFVSEDQAWLGDQVGASRLKFLLPKTFTSSFRPDEPVRMHRLVLNGEPTCFEVEIGENVWPDAKAGFGKASSMQAIALMEEINTLNHLCAIHLAEFNCFRRLRSVKISHLDHVIKHATNARQVFAPSTLEEATILAHCLPAILPVSQTRRLAEVVDFGAFERPCADFYQFAFELELDGRHSWIDPKAIAGERRSVMENVIRPFVASTGQGALRFLRFKDDEIARFELGLPPPSIDDVATQRTTDRYDPLSRTVDTLRLRPYVVSEETKCLTYLLWAAPSLLDGVLDGKFGHSERALAAMSRLVPTYLVVTNLGYPMGGGESYILQTCKLMSEIGYKVVWVSFIDSNANRYTDRSDVQAPFFRDVRIPGGMTDQGIREVFARYVPDVVHTHGAESALIETVARSLSIPVLVGYHFWSGLVKLGPTSNTNIKLHLANHSLERELPKSQNKIFYLASDFMYDVYKGLGGSHEPHIHYAAPDPGHYQSTLDPDPKYVVQINVAYLKGGGIFLDCVKELGDRVPFLAVATEAMSERFYREVADALGATPHGQFRRHGNVKAYYSQARIVIVPTQVDETFCRVAYEAAMNGIPVLSTSHGFLAQMFGPSGVFVDGDSADWIDAVGKLYHDGPRLKRIAEEQKRYLSQKFGPPLQSFLIDLETVVERSPRRSVGIFVAWSDQGLGNLAKSYVDILRSFGFRVHIFSYRPYSAKDSELFVQREPSEWSAPNAVDSVYYSFNDRENVTVHELWNFCVSCGVGTLLVPEICWQQNWDRLFSIDLKGLSVVAVPMAEIVLRQEATLHDRLSQTWFVTRVAETTLTAYGVRNGVYVGHGYGKPISQEMIDDKTRALSSRETIRYLHIGGHNPYHRKQTLSVVAAFFQAAQSRPDIELTVTCMLDLPEMQNWPSDRITFRRGTFGSSEILELYKNCDVSIQVSSHEGLGLGFYESIASGTPVISMDVPPHNEVIMANISGWHVGFRWEDITDNPNSLMRAAHVDLDDLANLLARLGRDEIGGMMRSTAAFHRERFSESAFGIRLLQALR